MKVNVEYCEKRAKEICHVDIKHIVPLPLSKGGLGVDPTYWNKVREGNGMSQEKIEKLAKILECPVSAITSTSDEEEKYDEFNMIMSGVNAVYQELFHVKEVLYKIVKELDIE